MSKEIGGYFSLELQSPTCSIPALSGALLNTGRNSIEYILRSIKKIRKLYIPYYTCDSVLEPIEKLNINYVFYHININLEIGDELRLGVDDYLLYTNYFGIKDEYINEIIKIYGSHLIVDNAQALFAEPIGKCAYSPRKFIGLPDGGIAFPKDESYATIELSESYHLCSHLLKRIDSGASSAYQDFKENSKRLAHQSIKQMSNLTKSILESTNFEEVAIRRKNNFEFLHSELSHSNGIQIPLINSFKCPMVYPYYVENDTMRDFLIANKIYVATYWPNVLKWCTENDIEYKLAKYIFPLPVDQRYDLKDMNYLLKNISK